MVGSKLLETMSGGHFNYVQYNLEDIADEIEKLVQENNSNEVDEYGQLIGRNYSEETIAELLIGVTFILAAATYIQRIDYLLSAMMARTRFIQD